MLTSSSARTAITSPSLPKGGGAITGMGESLGTAGPTGMATMSLPLPITDARGFAPPLALRYSSGAGNGIFGLGWDCSTPSISRRTSNGTPQYYPVNSSGPQDEFLGPDGEVLVAELKADGTPNVTTNITHYGSQLLLDTYTVIRYLPRAEGAFNRLEYWLGANGEDFWLLHSSDGSLHIFGKTSKARIYDPKNAAHTAEWLLEESLSPTGEDLWYQYVDDTSLGLDAADTRDAEANRYLSQVSYGNQTACSTLFLLIGDAPDASQNWLFTLVFDYGERGSDPAVAPTFIPDSSHPCPVRPDTFSRYGYGFELRTRRLCQQVLMFHHFPSELGNANTLVSRLLLEYKSDTTLSQLTAAQILAYEPDGILQETPPVEFGYTAFAFQSDASKWQPLPDFPGLNDGNPYHLVDLYGEGLPGILYRAGPSWYYRAPVRASSGDDNVDYAAWQPLSKVPAMQGQRFQLLDITGDGHLDWVVAQPGVAGFFTLNSNGSWGDFTPFSAFPLEFFHPQSQLTQLVGSGLADLALIGPKSVRLYANQGAGFAAGLDVAQDETLLLPVAGRDARALVAFADLLGSGQSHLLEIRYNQVRCWPNLGRGRFGSPLTLALPAAIDTEAAFNPDNLFLADVDGSGTTDLIYAQHNQVTLFFNLSGNGFSSPQTLALPTGVVYDRLCQINLADMQGNGCTELVLTVPYMTPCHWRYPFVSQKPYLLNATVNNLGATSQLTYRSSAQFWLDEKAETPDAVPALPFPMPLLCQTLTTDELTGNTLSSHYLYRQGVYDGKEREFRGFGYLESQDATTDTQASTATTPLAAPSLTRSWFHCGREDDESNPYGAQYSDDAQAPVLKPTRLTSYNKTTGQDEELDAPSPETQWWLYRALKGALLHSETWSVNEDGMVSSGAPYVCTTNRYQVRLVQNGVQPVSLLIPLEQLGLSYEQLSQDPLTDHQVTLQQDEYGTSLWQIQVAYPRRPSFTPSPYPNNLPGDAWANTYDAQQQVVRYNESRASVWHLDAPDYTDTSTTPVWCLGLPDLQRQNLITADYLPADGVSYETLMTLLTQTQTRYLRGQVQQVYVDTPPVILPALIHFTRAAVLDDTALAAYQGISGMPALDATNIGYTLWETALDVSGDAPQSLWAVESGFTTYSAATAFYCPLTQQSSALTGAVSLTWDDYMLEIATQTDTLGNTVSFKYDYRFPQPYRVVDINKNTHEIQLNALGQSVNSSVYGTENGGLSVGFSLVSDYPVSPSLTVESAITTALDSTKTQYTASLSVTDMFSWMGQITQADLSSDPATAQTDWQLLLNAGYITVSGYIREAGREWAASLSGNQDIPSTLAPVLAAQGGMPVHSVVCTADNYPDSATPQQVHVTVSYSDGFGRPLQQCALVAPGDAWQRESDGEVNTMLAFANPRWAVSGRVEYDNKGQVVRSYQPFFINDWQYVIDSSLCTQGYSDTHYYDALGRESQTTTALGYLRRTSYYSWFTVTEDENDTLNPGSGELV
ncbi:TPA: SpvB/TcaC N-terminal domain-containing protein [Salmonella enterica]